MGTAPITLDYASRDRQRSGVPMTRTRAVFFTLIGGGPIYFSWPFVIMLGNYKLLVWLILAAFSVAACFVAVGVVLFWNWLGPAAWTLDPQVSRRRWKTCWIVILASILLTPTTLPTRAILLIHLPLFSYLTRNITSQPLAYQTVAVEGYAGLYRFRATDNNGAIHFELWPWFGLTRDDGWIAWAPNGSYPYAPGGAGEGRLIGAWMWADVE